jgi:molybdopterin/thiamine biosynthesis adenylyltransferase
MTELHFAFAGDIERRLRSVLFPTSRPWQPERGVIGIVFRSRGSKRSTLLLHDLVDPGPGDVTWNEREGLLFSTKYKARATTIACQIRNAGIAFFHTHGSSADGSPPEPSPKDYESDRRDLYFLGQGLSDDAPLVAGIADDDFNWTIREYRFNYPRTQAELQRGDIKSRVRDMPFAERVRVCANRLMLRDTNRPRRGPSRLSASAMQMADSTIGLWGEEGQQILRGIRVAIVGLGGVGSILAEHVARLGVRDLVLIDFDRLDRDNFNRSQGATRLDFLLRRHKVRVAANLARKSAIYKDIEIAEIIGSVVERNTIPPLLDCDVILNASDSPWALQVLDHVAHAHVIPVITGGTVIKGHGKAGSLVAGKSEVVLSNPGVLCMECAGSYTRAGVTEAMERPNVRGPRRYLEIPDAPEAVANKVDRAPSVIATNGLVAALMLLRMQALVVGTTPDVVNGIQRFHILEGVLHFGVRTSCEPSCVRRSTVGLGNAHDLPTGIDQDQKYALANALSAARRCLQFLNDLVAETRS